MGGDEKAIMSAALETQREILENRQIAYAAHAEIAHAHIRSQVAQGCKTDGTSHAHRITIQSPSQQHAGGHTASATEQGSRKVPEAFPK